MDNEKDKLRISINGLGRALVNSNHYDQSDMIIARIYLRCQEYFDHNTIKGIEIEKMLEESDKK